MQQRKLLEMDTECYPNYWLIKFLDHDNPEPLVAEFDFWPGKELDRQGIANILAVSTCITFNGLHYDMPMVTLALAGANNKQLKDANDLIIPGGGMRGLQCWEFYRHFQLEPIYYADFIDIMDVAPSVKTSLKTYGGRMGSKRLQDLPIKPSDYIMPEQRPILSAYCTNDLLTTRDLYNSVEKAIKLRIEMSKLYGVDLRSKSDAQCAEAIFKTQLGFKPEKAMWVHGTPFKYNVPSFIQFHTPELCAVLDMIKACVFTTSDKDQVLEELDENGNKIKTGIIMPPELKKLVVSIGNSRYKMGIGGLHSMESKAYHHSSDLVQLRDFDVNSYYPSLILICGMFPAQLGERFIQIYREIYEGRLAAKDLAKRIEADMKAFGETDEKKIAYVTALVEAEAKKIVLNGTYGKLGSKYSIFFAPDLLIQVTLTGQLCLLMLISMLERAGIPVVSANTDGIVTKCPRHSEWLCDQIVRGWEIQTGLTTEETRYTALYSRDVNNYVAFKPDGKYKGKGIFTETGLKKSPSGSIRFRAAIEYLRTGTTIETTIRNSTNILEFLKVSNVKGGAVKNGVALGKVVRFYYGANETGCINYESNGNKVADSDGGVPMMDIKEGMPADLDYARYVQGAQKVLAEVGVVV